MFDQARLASTEFYSHRFKNFATMVIIPATCALILVSIFMFVAKREITIQTVGELTPTHAPLSIQATSNAQIVSNHLQEGRFVNKGETLLVYHQTNAHVERHILEAKQKEQQSVTHNYQITAPRSGILHVESDFPDKQYITRGTQLAEIVPSLISQRSAKLVLYVLPTVITSIHPGQRVRFQLARKVPVPVIINAHVVNIDVEPTITKSGNMFKVVATVRLTKALSRQLRYGMQGQASIITGKKTYWRYVIDQLSARK